MSSPPKTLRSIKNWMSTRWMIPRNMPQSSDTCLENRTSIEGCLIESLIDTIDIQLKISNDNNQSALMCDK